MADTKHIFEQWAKHLEAKASGIVMASIVVGGLAGGGLGGVPLVHLSNAIVPHHLGYATLLIGAAAGGYLGWRLGERRATGLRLQAEVARRQFQVEQSLIRRMMQLAPAPPAQQAPAPVVPPPAPAPVAPPPPPVPAPAPAPVTPLLTTPTPAAPAVPPVVSPIPAPMPEPPPAAAYAAPPLTGT